MNRNVEVVSFSHQALRGVGAVRVFQNVDPSTFENIATAGHDATARWVWGAATATADWLCDRGMEWIQGKRVVEIGAGTGLLGLVAARLGASSVTLTDLPTELPLLRRNLAANVTSHGAGEGACADRVESTNSSADGGGHCDVHVEACAWGDEQALAALGTFDVVLCSDVLYQNDENTQGALARTMSRLSAPRSGRVLFSYHFRENIIADTPFFQAVEGLFGDPVQHTVAGELKDELWLFEYRHLASES
eukprot:CAMPEP_0181358566 /NCGR_PEP_ID=MMETSP1106-20121128/5584_1 /TAXON_ID=81844 /ORGANISM="Mantoniella antarctica, Strain SL-175" /LENGTH=248 /DNA_ID=CAMNT_0023471547 /DNA_START=576 /DNA_END=1322 /DNA_ORIENTATION=-